MSAGGTEAPFGVFVKVSVMADRQCSLPEKDQMRKLHMQHHSSEFLNLYITALSQNYK